MLVFPVNSVSQKRFTSFKWVLKLKEFLRIFHEFDVTPVGQRNDSENNKLKGKKGKPSKAQSIIASILHGVDPGQITVHKDDSTGKVYVSIDGGHRKRYIKAFYEDEFPDYVSGKKFSQLSKEDQEYFLNIELCFCVYSGLTNDEVGRIFRILNETTQVNHQEMLNSYGNTPIANAIRNTVRVVPGVNNIPNKLFGYNQTSSSAPKRFHYFSFDNARFKMEEMLARVYYRYYVGGGVGSADDKDLEKMYIDLSSNEEKTTSIQKQVNKLLNFIYDIAEIHKMRTNNKLGQKHFVLFSRLWLYMEKLYEAFSIIDRVELYDAIMKEYALYTKPYDKQCAELKQPSPFDSGKTRGKQFNDNLGWWKIDEPIIQTFSWLMEKIDMTKHVIVKDPVRFFPQSWRERKLAEQGHKCAITGKPLSMKSAVGAHIIAHSQGGRTNYDNLAMIAAEHNTRMGSMSVTQYKKLL